jgi:hypothetical protein
MEPEMQLTLNLTFTHAPPIQRIFTSSTWLNAGWATACLGFTKKVEISQTLSDALGDEEDQDQQLYDALWLAHHHLFLDQRPSFSFSFDFLQEDRINGRLIERSLRLYLEEREQVILLGLLQDFQMGSGSPHDPIQSTTTENSHA